MLNSEKKTTHFNSLDSLRGIAALMIVFYHLVELVKVPLPEVLRFIPQYFGMGVPLFFTISGFVLAFGYADKLQFGGQEVINFYKRRFLRIAPLFYFVLIAWRVSGEYLWGWTTSIKSIFLNFTFLFGLVPGFHESLVMAGWSIGIEMLFYFIFPILILIVKDIKSGIVALLIACVLSSYEISAFSSLGSYGYMNIVTQLPFFMSGLLAYQIWRLQRFKEKSHGWICLLVGACLIAFSVSDIGINYLNKIGFGRNIWGIIFALLIFSSLLLSLSIMTRGPLKWFGERSYGAYLLHPIVFVVLIKINFIVLIAPLGVWGSFLVSSLLSLAVISLLSEISYRFIELPGMKLSSLSLNEFNFSYLKNQFIRRSSSLKSFLNSGIWFYITKFLTFFSLVYFLYLGVAYINQPLIDIHAFRQTQTALSSYWMVQEGWSLAYQTPVVGYPWSIPFEFPIYQSISAGVSWLSGIDLQIVGRALSCLFLILIAHPIFLIAKRLDLSKSLPYVICILLWTSPLYIYWGRSFMIETAATYFSLASIAYWIDTLKTRFSLRSICLFALFSTAAMLQKITTAAPVLLVLMALTTANIAISNHQNKKILFKECLKSVCLFLVPVLIGICWVKYTDAIKSENPFGLTLISKNLSDWNYGTLSQRLSLNTWKEIVWNRGFFQAAGGYVGLLTLIISASIFFTRKVDRKTKLLIAVSLLLYLLPLLIFINLHYVHEYYQVACSIFLIAAISMVICYMLPIISGVSAIIPVTVILMMLANISIFNGYYGIVMKRSIREQDPRSLQAYDIGRYLRDVTLPGTGLVIFGQTWSSEIPFHAQRKSMSVPPSFPEYRQLWADPQKYLGNTPISAIVVCPPSGEFPNISDINSRIEKESYWVHKTLYGCELLVKSNGQSIVK